jgi:hypothetical protein
VDADPDLDRRFVGARATQDLDPAAHRVGDRLEDDEETVALGPDLLAAEAFDRVSGDPAVGPDDPGRGGVALPVDQVRVASEVGEEEAQGAGRSSCFGFGAHAEPSRRLAETS